MKMRITRRQGLLAGCSAASLGLQAFVTGLPTWYLLNPRRATAQDLQCAINAREKPAVPDPQRRRATAIR